MARTDLQVNIRMPAELKERIERATDASGRSLNAEILYRLQRTFEANIIAASETERLNKVADRLELVLEQLRETGIGERALSSGATMVYEGLSSAERAMRQRQTTKKDKP